MYANGEGLEFNFRRGHKQFDVFLIGLPEDVAYAEIESNGQELDLCAKIRAWVRHGRLK